MSKGRVLLIGATGMLGEPVARRLRAEGWTVRCLSRDARRARAVLGDGFECVEGDVTRPSTLDAAFDGCDVLHLNLRGSNTIASYDVQEVGGAAACAAAARRHGMQRITYLSGSGRTEASLRHHFPVRIKTSVEASLAASGVPWTAFRATHFMESLPQFVRNGRAAVLGGQPHRLHYLAAEDYAGMVARALESTASADRALHLWGPESFTMHEALQKFLDRRFPGMKAGTLPLPVARLIAWSTGNQDLRFAAALFAAFAAIGEAGDPSEANRLLGTPRTTLEQWLARQEVKVPQ